jgi:hypothetical protein
MPKLQFELRWHLSRGSEPSCLLSEQELHLLAELGELRPTDLLWKPGLKDWMPADSIPGLLMPPHQIPNFSAMHGSFARLQSSFRSAVVHLHNRLNLGVALGSTSFSLVRRRSKLFARIALRRLKEPIGILYFGSTQRRIDHPRWVAALAITIFILAATTLTIRGIGPVEAETTAGIYNHTHSRNAGQCPAPIYARDHGLQQVAANTVAGFAVVPPDDVSSSTQAGLPDAAMPLPSRKPAFAKQVRVSMRSAHKPKHMRFGGMGFAYEAQR